MVSTRRKSYVPPAKEGESSQAPAAEGTTAVAAEVVTASDAADVAAEATDAADVTGAKKRRSVKQQAPKEVLTPVRRSRRLSNSSVESACSEIGGSAAAGVSLTPIANLTRKPLRGRRASAGEEDVEAKKAKVAEGDSLAVIAEEKAEEVLKKEEAVPVVGGSSENGFELRLEADDDIFEDSASRSGSVEDITKVNQLKPSKVGGDVQKETLDVGQKTEKIGKPANDVTPSVDVKEADLPKKEDKVVEVAEAMPVAEVDGKPCPEKKTDQAAPSEKPSVIPKVKQTKSKDKPTKPVVEVKETDKPQTTTLPCGAEVMKNIPRGRYKSGRVWKDPKSNPRYMYKDKGLKMPFEKIRQLRQERQRIKTLENRMKEEERQRRVDLNERRQLNKKRQEENNRKGEVVQVIRNTAKLKRMKKKQLRLIQKRDTATVA